MARAHTLKVFRTPAGFHDAYVAAPSQKAALEAWGADSNLFASGSAERVEDPELMREPLTNPGQVIRRLRGTPPEHVAALATKPKASGGKTRSRKIEDAAPAATRTPRPPKPHPSRATLDRAEAALAELEKQHTQAKAEFARQQAELDRARRTMQAKQEREQEKLQDRIVAARDKYELAMRAWRAD